MCENSDINRMSPITIKCINIYREAAGSEKCVDGIQVKLSPGQKEAVRKICSENNMDMSTFAREAVSVFIDLWPYREKIQKHHRTLRGLLEILR
jgi:hypothetical protein